MGVLFDNVKNECHRNKNAEFFSLDTDKKEVVSVDEWLDKLNNDDLEMMHCDGLMNKSNILKHIDFEEILYN